VNLLVVGIAKFSEAMLWLVGSLLVTDFAAMMFLVVRGNKAGKEEGTVILDSLGPLTANDLSVTEESTDVLVGSGYVAKEKVLLSRSEFITMDKLADGSATRRERFLVYGIQLCLFLFWLLFVFAGLTLLPSNIVAALFIIVIPSVWFFKFAAVMRKDRQNALHKVGTEAAGSDG
jgi:hypothetical protein